MQDCATTTEGQMGQEGPDLGLPSHSWLSGSSGRASQVGAVQSTFMTALALQSASCMSSGACTHGIFVPYVSVYVVAEMAQ